MDAQFVIYSLFLIGIFCGLSFLAKSQGNVILSIFWGILNAVLYIATGAMYKEWDVVKIYTAITCAIVFGGSRLIPFMIGVMLLVHLWVLVIGNARKITD